jgi:membrane protein implicated in regulation of membrane protease activity
MEMSVTYAWLIAGVILLAIEIFGFPGAGLLFAGLGAITTGTVLYLGLLTIDATGYQFILFFVSSAIWAAILWKPLQKIRNGKPGSGYKNMVGDTVYVGSQGVNRDGGEVTWSGTIMKAKLAEHAGVDHLEGGSTAVIVSVVGATLVIKPKH